MNAIYLNGVSYLREKGGGDTPVPGVISYNQLVDKPKINGIDLIGNMTSDELELDQSLTTEQLNALLALIPE